MLIESSLNSFTLNPRLMRTGLQTMPVSSVQCPPCPCLLIFCHYLRSPEPRFLILRCQSSSIQSNWPHMSCHNLASYIQPLDPLQTRADGLGPGSHTYSLVVLCVHGKMLLIPESLRVLGSEDSHSSARCWPGCHFDPGLSSTVNKIPNFLFIFILTIYWDTAQML